MARCIYVLLRQLTLGEFYEAWGAKVKVDDVEFCFLSNRKASRGSWGSNSTRCDMLDKRLKICADMVSGQGVVCDVGTDHAYLAAELIISGKCNKVIASDIKEGPLEAAAKTVEKYGVSDKVELVLSDGLENVCLDDVSDIVIAGMGGETIAEILDNCMFECDDTMNFILQPMTKAEVLRKWLGGNGFEIIEEQAVEDGDRVYIVIRAKFNTGGFTTSEARCLRGFVDDSTDAGRKYIANQCRSLQKKASALDDAGKKELALHYRNMAKIVHSGFESVGAMEIYEYLDSLYPFSTQEKWDNSGFLIEKFGAVSTVLLTLDIDVRAIEEAQLSGAELIISHHPVIFDPLKKIEVFSPVMALIMANIGAICMHTNLDKSVNGTNGVILRKLSEKFSIEGEPEILEDCGDGLGIGFICEFKNTVEAVEFGEALKEIFGCEVVKMNTRRISHVKRVAFCSGSGGSMLGEAIEKGCDAYITGDVKHDVWIDANNKAITLYDCGHFHTENLVLTELRYVLEQAFPQTEFIISEASVDPVCYIK